jgi:hypothetical protein
MPLRNSSGRISLGKAEHLDNWEDRDPSSEPAWYGIELPKVLDARGNLTFIEGNNHIPFPIQRVYYVYDVPSGSTRAGHSHKALHQLLLALSGSFDVYVESGKWRGSITLNRPALGLVLPPGVWRVIDNFSAGAVLMALASDVYKESDYIRSYDEFHAFNESRFTRMKAV